MASRKQVVFVPGYYKTKVGSLKAAFSSGTSRHTAKEQDSGPPPTVVSLENETVILGKDVNAESIGNSKNSNISVSHSILYSQVKGARMICFLK